MEIWASKCQVQPLRVVLLPRGALVQVWVRRKARIPAGRKSSSEYQPSVLWEMWGDGRSKVFLPQKCWQHLTEHRLKYLPCKSSAFSVESPSCSLETFKKWVEIEFCTLRSACPDSLHQQNLCLRQEKCLCISARQSRSRLHPSFLILPVGKPLHLQISPCKWML